MCHSGPTGQGHPGLSRDCVYQLHCSRLQELAAPRHRGNQRGQQVSCDSRCHLFAQELSASFHQALKTEAREVPFTGRHLEKLGIRHDGLVEAQIIRALRRWDPSNQCPAHLPHILPLHQVNMVPHGAQHRSMVKGHLRRTHHATASMWTPTRRPAGNDTEGCT